MSKNRTNRATRAGPGAHMWRALLVSACMVALPLRAQEPVVSNVQAQQLTDSQKVEIHYDLTIPSGGTATVTVKASRDYGAIYETLPLTSLSGAFGADQSAGIDKIVIWDVESSGWEAVLFAQARVRITATVGGEALADWVLIPGGTFAMGDHLNEPEQTMVDARPVHDVYISPFFIARTPLTFRDWKVVYDWALNHGYTFDHAGQAGSHGVRETLHINEHPVIAVSWYDAAKWCNAYTEYANTVLGQNLTPVYYMDDAQTVVYREGKHDVSVQQVNWSANGFRLPTEAEWEKAARGGLVGARWPWGQADIDFTRASYRREGYATTPVGSYAANGYGLYDMAGNVSEWTWDWYSATWYSQPEASADDTRGPLKGSYPYQRVHRGGSYSDFPETIRVARRFRNLPGSLIGGPGLRVARNP